MISLKFPDRRGTYVGHRACLSVSFLIAYGVSLSDVLTSQNPTRPCFICVQRSLACRCCNVRTLPSAIFMVNLRTLRSSAAWLTFGTFHIDSSWSWRIPSACQAIPSVLQFFLILFAPESPRWLIAKGREDEALHILAYYHANGNDQHPLVQFEFQEIRSAIESERAQKQTGWLQLVKTPGNRRRMRIIIAIAFFSQWSGNGLAYADLYSLSPDDDLTTKSRSYYLNKVFDTIGSEFLISRDL